MKKSLIALAALAATASFAQSSVTLSGNLDFAYGSIKAGTQAAETTVSTRDLTSSTSVINIIAVEDLGGGMKATAKFGIDPRHLSNDGSAFGRDELFVGVSGGFGNIRLGSPNSIGLTTYLAGASLGTGIGSGYAATALDYSGIRYNRSARYDSPSIGGLTVSVLHAPGAEAAVGPVFGSTNAIPAATAATEVGLSYANGPLTVAYANVAQAKYGTAVKTSTNILAANYKLGATTLSAGWNDGDATVRTTTTTKTEGYRVGVAHTMGAVTLLGSYAQQKTVAAKETVTGLRADYALSKRTVAYVGYENWDNAGVDRKTTAVGVRHSF